MLNAFIALAVIGGVSLVLGNIKVYVSKRR